MKNIFMMAIVCIAVFSCNHAVMPSSTPYANTEITNDQGKKILAGRCSETFMYHEPYKEWYDSFYNSYEPDSATIGSLRPLLKNKTIEIFLGSWCGDSKREVPRMLKLLYAASFDTANLRLVFVDNSDKSYKQSPQHEEKGKNIFRVPTFIIYQKNKKAGRIVESPVVSLEKDLLAILEKKKYIPNYQVVPYWQAHIKKRNQLLSDDLLKEIAVNLKPLSKHKSELNSYGYVLLARQEYKESLNIFKLNSYLYPQDAGTYDSLGEAYYVSGDNANARKYYLKVLELKPGDANATGMLKKMD